ncbi:MAG: 2-amino-4-hydroxy-6-hydroxymethyldihydropteridine diphosphokinase [Gallionellaceae bacterium]|nr:2-amino-4-hydroxy-6-hydroxymethyldihydropteridine diphosphokinase [Gallionellaceae bacterium]
MEHKVFIGLGSNLENPRAQVLQAIHELNILSQVRVVQCSALYRSAPVGYLDQPDFINAVAELSTTLAPRALLDALLALEHRCGRKREFLNSPRTLDLDVLLYDDLQHHEHGLTVPHPQMHLRAFVLQPLLEIAPNCEIPGIGNVAEMAAKCAGQDLERLGNGAK